MARSKGAALAAYASAPEIFSVYVRAGDGTRLAVDVALPTDRAADARLPALIESEGRQATRLQSSAEGALWRLANFSNPQYVVLQASSHGGGAHASPYTVGKRAKPPVLGVDQQLELHAQFFDHYMKGVDSGVELTLYQLSSEPQVRPHLLV